MAMAGLEERTALAKLEALKDIRAKTIGLEKTRAALLYDVGQLEEEERCLTEYRRELELLQQVCLCGKNNVRFNARQRVMNDLSRARLSWFVAHPLPLPVRKLEPATHAGRLRKRDKLMTGQWGNVGGTRSRILYKSFNTLCRKMSTQ